MFAKTVPDKVSHVVTNSGLTEMQIHGEEPCAVSEQLRQYLPNIEIIKAFRIHAKDVLQKVDIYIGYCRYPIL